MTPFSRDRHVISILARSQSQHQCMMIYYLSPMIIHLSVYKRNSPAPDYSSLFHSFSPLSSSSSLTPPPYDLFTYNNTQHSHHRSLSSMENLKPSLIIIILILAITVFLSISLCLLLRHLNRRCLRHLSTVTTVSSADSRRVSSRRVSPDNPAFSVMDSLPLFAFSSVSRRSSSGGDCAICLFKFEPHDRLRLLPLCCHAFHARCIDTWLESNLTCPLCRSPIIATETDVMKAIHASSGGGSDSFRLEIGSISRRQAGNEPPGEPQRRSYSLGSFDYVVDEESDITTSQIHRGSMSDKEEVGAQAASEANLASEVAAGRSWLKDYVDRLSFSVSSRAMSFRSSGRFFTGSSRQSDVGDYDMETNRVGEEISEFFRWFSGV